MNKWTVLIGIGLFFLWIIYLRIEKDREQAERGETTRDDTGR